ncbi:hypothetical protein LTR99_010285 [Exophiala xenobiotica]|uniref:Circumsporozoite protein n=1 Tax=Vermiconidia calcicola TaxID=1690605 RepID=A0AAV9Q6P1_9PEZI|nr:hypothetical protein LTR96_010791 [Exophiala xenobiotica]KAK5534004.1 hypothetical protein LTR25_006984 [Vermiconidia calcicola]KAK5534920.1 hypothetical protein LTR23_008595 [Chaetothyriales sp. CCFEE 6169]KAK5292537.1 hypothetical protein LTR99_010285 [Exophiala xenobiotica]KAK5342214.1 hypothetical protein LTR98_003008 [Exophiala xenobiotica]
MYFQAATLAALIAVAHARFGQEQIPIPAIAAVQGGAPGVAQTIAGAAVSDLLAATNACDKLKRGDQIISELGTGADAIAAAIGIVAAEKNFNPFAQSIPTICDDPTLPATDVLRGITPLIDPAVVGSDVANALFAQTKVTPLDATGKSVADLLAENGFTNFTTQDAAGNAGAAPAGDAAVSDAGAATAAASTEVAAASTTAAVVVCGGAPAATEAATTTEAAAVSTTTATAEAASTTAASSGDSAVQASTVAGADFGLCVPTMKFEGGLGGRPATEFTFLPIDPLCAQGQQEALNPNIITNRICDQLTNVCEANDAAKSLCRDAQAQIQALGTRDKITADIWNTLLGFEGAVTNPDGGADSPPAKMRMVRSYRA